MLDIKQVNMRSVKIMGGIGAILSLVVFVPFLSLPGLVLVLFALKKISDETKRRTIFKDFLIGVIFTIVAVLLVFLVRVFTSLSAADEGFEGFELEAFFFAFLLCWVVLVIGASFIKMSFEAVADVTGEYKFATAGKLIFWGAVLLIVYFLGGIVLWIGGIIEAVAFFSLPDILELEVLA